MPTESLPRPEDYRTRQHARPRMNEFFNVELVPLVKDILPAGDRRIRVRAMGER